MAVDLDLVLCSRTHGCRSCLISFFFLTHSGSPCAETLREIFSEFGEIEYCAHLSEKENPSRKRGFGFVTFAAPTAAEAALENLDGLEVDGRAIKVNMAQPKF